MTAHTRGFTLIELLVVIAIIGILSSVVLASLNNARTAARDVKRMEDMRQLKLAIDSYFASTGTYLGNTHYSSDVNCVTYGPQTLSSALQPLVTGGYTSVLPEDPVSGGCYRYSRVTSSALTCGGTGIAAFEYVLMFTTERPKPQYQVAANWPGASGTTNYCIPGPLK